MKTFDITFTNPPYNKNLDIKIIKFLIENNISKEIICIHPTSFLFNKKMINQKMKQYLQDVNIFWGNNIFNIKLFIPICISNWNKNNFKEKIHVIDNAYSKETYEDCFENINQHGCMRIKIVELKRKIEKYITEKKGSIIDHHINEKYENMTDYSVKFSYIRGNVGFNKVKEDFWSLISKDENNNKCDKNFRFPDFISKTNYVKNMTLWSFKNKKEQDNFIIFCKTKIVRFFLTFTKYNSNLMTGETKIIPWMDFTRRWTDKDLCKEFNIDKELWDYIDKFIPDYYEDYKEICKG